jgi:hypothetical protein
LENARGGNCNGRKRKGDPTRKNTSLDHKGGDLSPKAQSRELAKCQELEPSLQLIPNERRIRKGLSLNQNLGHNRNLIFPLGLSKV